MAGFASAVGKSKPVQTYFKPPYVGGRGWVGIALKHIGDQDLRFHIQVAWELSAPKRLLAEVDAEDRAAKRSQK